MRDELASRLLQWRKDTHGETKLVGTRTEIQPDKTKEYTITLTMSITVRFENLSKNIEEKVWFLTYGQSPMSQSNPNGDINIFEIYSKSLAIKFFNTVGKILSEFSQEITPDGFSDLKEISSDMFHVEILIISLTITRNRVERIIVNEHYKFFKYNSINQEETCFTQAEADLFCDWLRQFPRNFDTNSIEINNCEQDYVLDMGKLHQPYVPNHTILHMDSNLRESYNLPFHVIGYPI